MLKLNVVLAALLIGTSMAYADQISDISKMTDVQIDISYSGAPVGQWTSTYGAAGLDLKGIVLNPINEGSANVLDTLDAGKKYSCQARLRRSPGLMNTPYDYYLVASVFAIKCDLK